MTPRKPPSEAILDLCDKINAMLRERHTEHSYRIGPRKIERWLQEELLPPPSRPGRGRGSGRDVLYEPLHVEVGVDIAELLRRYHSGDVAAIVLFVRRRPIGLERVRRGFIGTIARQDDEIEAAALREKRRVSATQEMGDSEPKGRHEAIDRAELAEPVIAARLDRGIYRSTLRENLGARAGVEAIVGAVLKMFLGSSPEAAADMEQVGGVLGIDKLFAMPMPRGVPTFESLAEAGDRKRLETLATTTSDESLIEAREVQLALVQVCRSIGASVGSGGSFTKLAALVLDTKTEVGTALGILGLLALSQDMSCTPSDILALTEETLNRVTADCGMI